MKRVALRFGAFACLIASLAVFIACLTQTAFVTPFIETPSGPENMDHAAYEWLALGWAGLLFAIVRLFDPTSLWTGVFWASTLSFIAAFRKKWRLPAVATACLTLCAMWFLHALAYAAWLANPLLLAAWIFLVLKRARKAAITATSAFCMMLGFLSNPPLPLGLKDAFVHVVAYERGYWLWVLSAGIVVVGAGLLTLVERRLAASIEADTKAISKRRLVAEEGLEPPTQGL